MSIPEPKPWPGVGDHKHPWTCISSKPAASLFNSRRPQNCMGEIKSLIFLNFLRN